MVGCVITDAQGSLVGWGFHRKVGGPHAEREALKRAGSRARGGTAFVTLEPCNRTGRTPPCTHALIEAGIRRVVFAQRDPHPAATGSQQTLHAAGIDVEHRPHEIAQRVSQPFVHAISTSLPFVIAKWAQSRDGKLAMPAGSERWISCERSRRMVHRERGRVDAILTGIGTILADDPLLTVRNARQRRTPARIVIDPKLVIPNHCQLLATIDQAPIIIVSSFDASPQRAEALMQRGATVLRFPTTKGRFNLGDVLHDLATHRDITTVLTECGPGLMRALFAENLVNMMWVFIAPMELGDASLPSLHDTPERLAAAEGMTLLDERKRGVDVMQLYGEASGNP